QRGRPRGPGPGRPDARGGTSRGAARPGTGERPRELHSLPPLRRGQEPLLEGGPLRGGQVVTRVAVDPFVLDGQDLLEGRLVTETAGLDGQPLLLGEVAAHVAEDEIVRHGRLRPPRGRCRRGPKPFPTSPGTP